MGPNTHVFVQHISAADLTPSWIGRQISVGTLPPSTLSDFEQHPTAHRTVVYLSGQAAPVDVHERTTVTRVRAAAGDVR